VFSIQTERVVAKDNTVAIRDPWWQLDNTRWRHMLAGQTVTIHQHLDGTVSIRYGPHVVGRGKDGSVESVENQTQGSHAFHRPYDFSSRYQNQGAEVSMKIRPDNSRSIKPYNYKS